MPIINATLNFWINFFRRTDYRMTAVSIAVSLIISSCTSVRGYPDRLIEPGNDLANVRNDVTREKIDNCKKKKDESCRNEILTAKMKGIDINFSEFERKLFRENRYVSFLTTVTTLGLTTAGAMTGTAVLSGIATGIVGSKEAFDKEILVDQAATAIHTKMRALRQTVANRIRYQMTKSFDTYPLHTALLDIEEYYNAGTLLGAFIGITASAGQQIEQSDVNKERIAQGKDPLIFSPLINPAPSIINEFKIERHRINPTETTKAISKWFAEDRDNRKKPLQDCFDKQTAKLPPEKKPKGVSDFLEQGGDYGDLPKAVLDCLNMKKDAKIVIRGEQ